MRTILYFHGLGPRVSFHRLYRTHSLYGRCSLRSDIVCIRAVPSISLLFGSIYREPVTRLVELHVTVQSDARLALTLKNPEAIDP